MGFLRLTGRRNMREYSIKDRQHTVYEDSSELPNNFIYKDKEGKTDNHFKKLPLKSKKLFLKIFNKHFKKGS